MKDGSPAPASHRLAFADGLRGLAALWVVLFHLSVGRHLDGLRAWLPATVDRVVFDWGHGGVAVFFVLSGCVMALTVERLALDPARAGRFVLRRLVRIAPPYYVAVLLSLALGLLEGHAYGLGQLVAHVFFLQTLLGYEQVDIVFWTLCIEIQFYIAFAAITGLADATGPRRAERARTPSRIAIAALSLAWPLGWLATSVASGGFLPFWAYFMAGVLAWDAMRGRRASRLAAIALAGALLVAGVARDDLFSGVAGLTALALLAADAAHRMASWLAGQWSQGLGRVSYSLYLVHVPVIDVTARVLHRTWPGPGIGRELAGAAACLGASLAAAWLFWRFIEQPAIRWSRRFADAPFTNP